MVISEYSPTYYTFLVPNYNWAREIQLCRHPAAFCRKQAPGAPAAAGSWNRAGVKQCWRCCFRASRGRACRKEEGAVLSVVSCDLMAALFLPAKFPSGRSALSLRWASLPPLLVAGPVCVCGRLKAYRIENCCAVRELSVKYGVWCVGVQARQQRRVQCWFEITQRQRHACFGARGGVRGEMQMRVDMSED